MSAWVPNGTSYITCPTLGDLRAAKFAIEILNFSIFPALGVNYYMFSQAGLTTADRELGLFLNTNGAVELFGKGNANVELASTRELFFGGADGSIDNVKFYFEVDLDTGDWSTSIDDSVVSSGTVSLPASRRTDGVLFRVGARGTDDTAGSTGGDFMPPDGGMKVGDFSIYIDDVLVRDYTMPAGTATAIPESVSSDDATLQDGTGDGSDWESTTSTAPVISVVSDVRVGSTVTVTTGSAYGTISALTLNGVDVMPVTPVDSTSFTFECPDAGVGAELKSNVDLIVTDENGESDPFSVELLPRSGWDSVVLSGPVNYVGGSEAGDVVEWETPVDYGGETYSVQALANGIINYDGEVEGIPFNYRPYDASDNYTVYPVNTITSTAEDIDAPEVASASDLELGETVTVTTTASYGTITALTLGGVDVMPVTPVDSTSFTFVCPVDGVGAALKSNVDLVAENSEGASPPYSAQLLPRPGWDSIVLTTAADYHAGSAAGDVVEWETPVDYGGETYSVAALADGSINYDGLENGIPFNFRVFDASATYTPSSEDTVTQQLPPIISAVGGLQLGETITVTTSADYGTISALTVNGVDMMPVTPVDSTSFTFDLPANGVGAALKSNVDIVATNANGESAPYSAQLLPRPGWDSVVLDEPFLFVSGTQAGDVVEWEASVEYNLTTYNPVGLATGRIDFDGTENGIPFNYRIFDSTDNYTPSAEDTLLRNDEPNTYIFDDVTNSPVYIPARWHYSNIVDILGITVPVDSYIVRDDGGQVHFRTSSSAPWGPWHEVGDPDIPVENGWQSQLRVKNSELPETQTGCRLYVNGFSNGFEVTTGTEIIEVTNAPFAVKPRARKMVANKISAKTMRANTPPQED